MGKEELLVTSNFSFSHNVCKSCLLLMRQNKSLWSKGLIQCFLSFAPAKQCQHLRHVELHHMRMVTKDITEQICEHGFGKIRVIKLMSTPIEPEGISILSGKCSVTLSYRYHLYGVPLLFVYFFQFLAPLAEGQRAIVMAW